MVSEYRIRKASIINKEYFILACATLLVFFIHIMHVRDMSILKVLDDEYGYWGNAAYLAGLNWADTVSKIPYYSYGYSLLLVPLFWIFKSTMNMYRAAIVLNGIMLSISFLLCYDIAKKLMFNVNKYILMSISFLISIYPTYIVYSNIAWSECLLVLNCWILTWCFVGLNNKSNIKKFILIGFLSGYTYTVHQRSLGILVASIIVILLMKIFNKINIKQFLSVVIPFILIIIGSYYLKNNIQNNLWVNGISHNDYSDQIQKLNKIFTLNGLSSAFKEVIGQLFYLGIASYLIFYLGLYELINKIGKTIINSFRNKSSITINDDNNFFVYLFLITALILSISISIIFMINPTRLDEIIYGRYTEMIIGPVLLVGFINLMNKEIYSGKLFLSILFGFSILTVITDLIIKSSGFNMENCNGICIAGLFGLFILGLPWGIYIQAFICLFICRLLWISFINTKTDIKRITITVLLITAIFFISGNKESIMFIRGEENRMQVLNVVDKINSTKEHLPIYFLCKDPNNFTVVMWDENIIRDRSVANYYQFLLKDKSIKLVNSEQLSKISGKKFVITTTNELDKLTKDYSLIGNDEGSYLFVSKVKK